jgi:molecular chaperone GrpE
MEEPHLMPTGDQTPQPDTTADDASAHTERHAADPAAQGDASAPTSPEAERERPGPAEAGDPAAELGTDDGTSEQRDATADGDTTDDGETEEPDPVAVAERQRDQYLDHLRRERAEFENFRRRAARERSEAADRGAEQIVSNLVGVLDNFGFILEAAKNSPDEALSKGAAMVYAELMDVLGKSGLDVVPGAGEPFDPTHHEAMLQVDADEPVDEPTVAEVLRPGYRFKGRLLRPASVAVKQ